MKVISSSLPIKVLHQELFQLDGERNGKKEQKTENIDCTIALKEKGDNREQKTNTLAGNHFIA